MIATPSMQPLPLPRVLGWLLTTAKSNGRHGFVVVRRGADDSRLCFKMSGTRTEAPQAERTMHETEAALDMAQPIAASSAIRQQAL